MIVPREASEVCPRCGRETTFSAEGFGPYCDGCGLPTNRCPCIAQELGEIHGEDAA